MTIVTGSMALLVYHMYSIKLRN